MKRTAKFAFLGMAFFWVLLATHLALAQDILQPLTDTSSEVSGPVHKVKKDKDPKPIRLISPDQNSQFSPGTISFSWKLTSKNKEKKVTFVLEKTDTHRVVSQVWRGESLNLNLKLGSYRWQITSTNPKSESRWRTFEVVEASDSPPKGAPDLAIESPSSETQPGQQEELGDKKLQEYKKQKLKAEQLARELKNQLELVRHQRLQALAAAKEEAAQLQAARLAAKQKAAKLEADRQAKIRADKAAKEKVAKLRAKQISEIRIAKARADRAAKKLAVLIKKESAAKLEAEMATRELASKVEAERQEAGNPGQQGASAPEETENEREEQ